MQQPYTLIIPSWYPVKRQPLNGIFIEKHVQAISGFTNAILMYTVEAETQTITEEVISPSYIKYTSFYTQKKQRIVNQINYVLAQRRAYNYIVKKYGSPALIHLQVVFPAGIFVYLLLLFKNIPLIITEHWSGYTTEDGRYQKQPYLFKFITAALFKKAKKVSVVSAYLKQAIIKLNLAPQSKISIVSNLLNMPNAHIAATTVKPQTALFIGNLNDHEKNITLLIEAIELLVKKHPDFQLSLIGGGNDLQRYTQMAADKGLLDKNILFYGYVPNSQLAPFYAANSFFILTSNFETFNIAAAEALLWGMPVVSTMCGGPEEYINPNTGIWIKENSAHGIAAAIIEMIERRGTFNAKNIAENMQQQYGNDTILKQLKNLYTINTN